MFTIAIANKNEWILIDNKWSNVHTDWYGEYSNPVSALSVLSLVLGDNRMPPRSQFSRLKDHVYEQWIWFSY